MALAKAKDKPAPIVEKKAKFETKLTNHELENLVQITGRFMRGGRSLEAAYMGRKTGCDKVTENDVKWAKEEVLRRSPDNDQYEIVAKSIWP